MWTVQLYSLLSLCPPPNVAFAPELNLSAYVKHPWYVQEQMAVIYQQPHDLFCVRDTYTMDGDDALFLETTWNVGSTDGKPTKATLHGLVNDQRVPSHFSVGFKWMPKWMRGPYWVIATYPEGAQEEYEWAIVSGGPPTHVGENGKCRLGTWFNNSGLWLFTKDPVPPAAVVAEMRRKLDELGYDLSVLIKVDHQNCVFPDADSFLAA